MEGKRDRYLYGRRMLSSHSILIEAALFKISFVKGVCAEKKSDFNFMIFDSFVGVFKTS